MKQIYSNIIQFRGTHYDFGLMQGKNLKNSYLIKNREKQWRVRKPRFIIDEKEAKDAITRFSPAIWEELIGLGDALEWSMERVLKEFGGYRLDYVRSGCSIVTGDDFFIRNYDYHPKTYEGRFVFFQPTDGGYAFVGPSQRVVGRTDGINEHGLVVGYNFMHRKKPGDGFICAMIARLVLEGCANVKEAVKMLNDIPHRHSFSYIVYDGSGETFIVEASPRGIEVRQSNACTNHFDIMKQENRNYLVDSYRRKEIIDQYANKSDAYATYQLLNDMDKGVFSTQYKSWAGTIHTTAYFPNDMNVWITLGGNQQPTVFDFGQWLKGKQVEITNINGQVDTDLPFVHMNENVTWYRNN
ncbi:C45 family autoproteolytic acyltransferase/hydolase [Aquibacillus albus]|uniref:Choloylglycine hydrolase n=1 Tax=Aquibacillus albus TaxID=1168171 RepID=A0ABS2MY88_9BACI|nr:C45 family peptidase [Aquibacillus albus]MBM7570842.1 putative choloylglycine hydrolase [Aquibacillus albus]